MQTTLLSLAIALILALLAALLGPYFIDWNTHRGTFEQQAGEALGLPVRVTGPMDVRLLPSPSLVLSGVEIGKAGDPQALRAKALAIEFALPPLFSGKLRAVEMKLIGPQLALAVGADGRAGVPAALAGKTSGLGSESFSIDKLTIEDATVRLSDAASGTTATLDKLWFNGDVKALPGPIRGEGAFQKDGALYAYRISTGRPEQNGSRIRLGIDPADRAVAADIEGLVTAENGAPRFDGQMTVARRIVASAKGDKLNKADLAALEPWKMSAKVKASAASALFEQLEFQYGPDERALKLAGTAEAKFGAQPRLDVVLSARQLDADKLLANTASAGLPPRAALVSVLAAAGDIAPPPIPTQIGFGIDAVTLGGGTLQNVRGDIELGGSAAMVSGVEARGPGFTQLQASGRIETDGDRMSFAGPVEITSSDPRGFADWLEGRAVAAMPSRPMRMRGDVALAAGRIAVERMRAEIDRKTLDGSFSYVAAQGDQRSRLDLNLRADEFDLDALMQFAGSAKAAAELPRPDDISLALALGRLRAFGADAGKADVRLALNADGLTIDRLVLADVAGLAIDSKGRIDLTSQAPRGSIAFSLDVKKPDLLAMLADRNLPAWLGSWKPAVAAAAPAKLSGSLNVEPSGKGELSRATLTLSGPMGAAQLNLKALATGGWKSPGDADVAVDASLDAGDVNTLVALAAAEKWVSVPRQPGTYTLSLNGKPDGDMKLDTRVVSANLDARAQGTVRPFAENKSAALGLAIGKADVVIDGKAIPVALKTQGKVDALGLRLDNLAGSIAGSPLRGRVSVAFGDKPAIDGDVKAESLDVGNLLAMATGIDAAKKPANEKWNEIPFALPTALLLDGTVKIEAARATLSPQLTASNLKSTLRFAPMQVRAESLEADIFGGHASADIALRRDAGGLGVQGRVTIKNADAAQLLFGETVAPLSGRAGLNVQFEGAGLSPRALVGSLNGTGILTLEKSRLASLDPRAFSAAMRSVDQGLPLDAPRIREVVGRALETGPLVVNNAEASITIAGGVARIETFTASTDAADIAVTGSYNLASARIDTRFALTGAPVAGTSLRPELSVMLRGAAATPERTLDVSALTGWLALRSVDRQTKRLEAIEQGRPAEAALQPHEDDATTALPDAAPVLPRAKPAQPPQPSRPQSLRLEQPALDPLPPPVEVRPSPGERRRVPQPPQQRVESPPRIEAAPRAANPFPTPIGTPPPPVQPQQNRTLFFR